MTEETRPSLYQLTAEGVSIKNLLLDESIEDKDTLQAALDKIECDFIVKVENIRNLIIDWRYFMDNIDSEVDRLKRMKESMNSRIEWLKSYTLQNMIALEQEKYEYRSTGGEVKIATNPPSVDVIDEKEVPAAYIRIKTEESVNKKAILDNWKESGNTPKGVRVVTDKLSLRVK